MRRQRVPQSWGRQALIDRRGIIDLAHQQSSAGYEMPEGIRRTKSKVESLAAIASGTVVAGTAWLWSDEELERELDYLFIDEAGQMSLAMALAAGRSAQNIVLLGDPQQLEQPQQATHPQDSGIAALDHVLGGVDTIPESKGLFLSETWRLQPAICEFTSEQFSESRLASVAGLEAQTVHGVSPYSGSGLRLVNVEHRGNQSRSYE